MLIHKIMPLKITLLLQGSILTLITLKRVMFLISKGSVSVGSRNSFMKHNAGTNLFQEFSYSLGNIHFKSFFPEGTTCKYISLNHTGGKPTGWEGVGKN